MAERICGFSSPSQLIGMPVAQTASLSASEGVQAPYIFYCGRVEGAKGASTLFDNFSRFKQQRPSELKLVLAGHAVEQIPARPDIEFLGFVSEARKLQLMRDAVAFVHPSPFESFSIVLLEAFLNGTPALVNAESTVLAEHCLEAEAGVPFESYEDFSVALSALLQNPALRAQWGENGRRYVQQNYSREAIAPKLRRVFEAS
jgi:glycosyltransferase involved in cell wall biosynthesis